MKGVDRTCNRTVTRRFRRSRRVATWCRGLRTSSGLQRFDQCFRELAMVERYASFAAEHLSAHAESVSVPVQFRGKPADDAGENDVTD